METYKEMMDRHQKEFAEFPKAFAMTEEDLKEGLIKLGLNENDKDKIVGIGFGGFIKKEDEKALKDLQDRHYNELQEAIKNDKTGENFILGMFDYELANHEYGYHRDISGALMACGITYYDLEKNENLRNGLKLAIDKYSEQSNQENEEEEL